MPANADTPDSASNGRICLVTGVNGFLGAHVAKAFLEHGWIVRGTARSKEKFDALRAAENFVQYGDDKLQFVLIEDVGEADFTEAVKGVEAVAHTASPFNYDGKCLDDYMKPAVQGTAAVLTAASKESSVKHVVFCSSFAAVGDFSKPADQQKGKVYNEDDWNPMTDSDAAKKDSPGTWYACSKKYSELKALEIAKDANFTLSTICPPLIIGPIVHAIPDGLDSLNESCGQLWTLISGRAKEVPSTPFPAFADVREVARAHVMSVERRKEGRFVVANGSFDWDWVAELARAQFPAVTERIPGSGKDKSPAVDEGRTYTLDGSKAAKELGLIYHRREQTFGDTVGQFLGYEQFGKFKKEVEDGK